MGIVGVFGVLSVIGGYENFQINTGQFFLYEFLSFSLIWLTYIVYNIRSWFNYTFIESIKE
jgi:hypothetical protein